MVITEDIGQLPAHTPMVVTRVDTSEFKGVDDHDCTSRASGMVYNGATSGFGRQLATAAVAAGDVVIATNPQIDRLDDLLAAHRTPGRAAASGCH